MTNTGINEEELPKLDCKIIPDRREVGRITSLKETVVLSNIASLPENERSKYHKEILPGIWVDVYDVIGAFNVTDGGFQHALKKILACGQRGYKNEEEDRKDIHSSIVRSNQRFNLINKVGI